MESLNPEVKDRGTTNEKGEPGRDSQSDSDKNTFYKREGALRLLRKSEKLARVWKTAVP